MQLRLLTCQTYIPTLVIGSSARVEAVPFTGIGYRSSNDPGSKAD